MRCCLRLVLAHDSHARQVTTAADGGFNDAWIMRFGQSAEDGAMPLIHCCVAPDVQDRDFFEPPGAKGRLLRERVVEREEERAGGGGGGEGGTLSSPWSQRLSALAVVFSMCAAEYVRCPGSSLMGTIVYLACLVKP